MTGAWLLALIRRRTVQAVGVAVGIALAVGLLASVGGFIGSAQSTMTARAASDVTVDWQVQVAAGSDVPAVTSVVRAASGVTRVLPVGYGAVRSLSATTGSTTQRTGSGVVLGLPPGYAAEFPGQLRLLAGTGDGVLVAQQTAANLHVAPGDRVLVDLGAGVPRPVVIGGVVDLPHANSLFQTVGAPVGAQPNAPPDNVLLLPASTFRTVFAGRGDLVTTQLHVRRTHALPADPTSAAVDVAQAANNLTAKLAGHGLIGDNLGASLAAARADASYARVLFLFLGLPGAALAGLLTIAVAGADRETRRRDQALLRLRGASRRAVLRLAFAEAALLALVGGVAGLALAGVASWIAFGPSAFSADAGWIATWSGAAFAAGILVAIAAIVVPTLRDLNATTVLESRRRVVTPGRAWWERMYLDLLLLAGGIVLVVITTQAGYSLVLAPEGVPTINVNYWAFLGPALIWVGAGLLIWRLVELLLTRRRTVSRLVRPAAGLLAGAGASSFLRQRRAIARSSMLMALAFAFAVSTAVFDSTYQQQAEVDARLTNGADVRVTTALGAETGPSLGATIASVPGVRHVEPVQHRYAYVGADLQDLYGVNPATIASATSLQDAYFAGGTAAQLLQKLAATPDGVLVSQETAKDYQLNLGDRVTLRLPDARTRQQVPVTFRYIGQALEFPTAPKDSFLIANAGYVAQQTHSDAVGTFLVTTDGTGPGAVAAAIRSRIGTAGIVTPIGVSRASIGSSLTSVDLAGLTRLELAFALALGAAAGGLVLVLGMRQRRSSFAVMSVLGATRGQLRGLVAAEGALTVTGGLVLGSLLGVALSEILVAVLTGVFDPPPAALAVPWGYLAAVALVTVAGVAAVSATVTRRTARPPIESLRDR
ncbi:MAG TPA: FtsX-like permease family protein [Amnibacterium sp.]|nr:FtsX-like permease family protein [Amnibacterium sp.]